jgi:hypothetical protein
MSLARLAKPGTDPKKAFEPQRRKEREGKTMHYWHLSRHLIGEYPMDLMFLCSLRLRVFAVDELRFPG